MNPFKTLVALALLVLTPLAHAFDLQQLSDQLSKPAVIHGAFVQEKHLRSLPQPLTSKGNFVLAKDSGLLWLLETPLKQDHRRRHCPSRYRWRLADAARQKRRRRAEPAVSRRFTRRQQRPAA
jgi:hypothetical protein